MFQYMHYLFNETEINNFKILVSPENHSNPFRKKWTDYSCYKKKKVHGQKQTATRSPGRLLDNSNTLTPPCKNFLGVLKYGISL